MCRAEDSSAVVRSGHPGALTFKPHHAHLAAAHAEPAAPPHPHLHPPPHVPPLHHTLPLHHHVHLHPRTPLLARLQPHPAPGPRRRQPVPRQPPRPRTAQQDPQLRRRPRRAARRVQQRALSREQLRPVRQRPPPPLRGPHAHTVQCAFAPWPRPQLVVLGVVPRRACGGVRRVKERGHRVEVHRLRRRARQVRRLERFRLPCPSRRVRKCVRRGWCKHGCRGMHRRVLVVIAWESAY